jgi:hypothetical protein
MRKGAFTLACIAVLLLAVSVSVALAATRPPSGRYSGEGGSVVVNKSRRAVTSIGFEAEIAEEASDCSEATPNLGKVKVAVHGSFPITLDRTSGYEVWISGHPSPKAYHQVAPLPATFTFGSAGPSAKGRVDLIWEYGRTKSIELYAEVDGCTWYILDFRHR